MSYHLVFDDSLWITCDTPQEVMDLVDLAFDRPFTLGNNDGANTPGRNPNRASEEPALAAALRQTAKKSVKLVSAPADRHQLPEPIQGPLIVTERVVDLNGRTIVYNNQEPPEPPAEAQVVFDSPDELPEPQEPPDEPDEPSVLEGEPGDPDDDTETEAEPTVSEKAPTASKKKTWREHRKDRNMLACAPPASGTKSRAVFDWLHKHGRPAMPHEIIDGLGDKAQWGGAVKAFLQYYRHRLCQSGEAGWYLIDQAKATAAKQEKFFASLSDDDTGDPVTRLRKQIKDLLLERLSLPVLKIAIELDVPLSDVHVAMNHPMFEPDDEYGYRVAGQSVSVAGD